MMGLGSMEAAVLELPAKLPKDILAYAATPVPALLARVSLPIPAQLRFCVARIASVCQTQPELRARQPLCLSGSLGPVLWCSGRLSQRYIGRVLVSSRQLVNGDA